MAGLLEERSDSGQPMSPPGPKEPGPGRGRGKGRRRIEASREVDPQDLLERLRRHVEHDIAPEMHAVDPATGFEFEPISRIPGFDTDENSEIVQLVKSITGQNSTGKVAFGTEAGLFETQAGIPTVICGPGYIDQAHKPDEFVALEQIARCEQFIRSLFERCS